MLGITIRRSVSHEEISTAAGAFDISRRPGEKLSDFNKRRDQASSKLIGDLAKIGFFKKESAA